MTTTLISGATGFIGSRLALRLLEKGKNVRILALANNEIEKQNAELLESLGAEIFIQTITDRGAVFKIVEGVDTVFHLAAAQHEAGAPDQLFIDTNVTGTKNILDASVAAGVRRFVHGSSIGVYGEVKGADDNGHYTEESPTNPLNIYTRTKKEGEDLAVSYMDKLPVVVIRIAETFGPGDFRLLKLYKGVQKGRFPKIGKGQNLHHLTYIEDLMDGFELAASKEEAVGEIFILSGKEAIPTDEMIDVVTQTLDAKPFPIRLPLTLFTGTATVMDRTLRPLGIDPPLNPRRMDFFKKSFVFSSEKAQETIGFTPTTSFAKGSIPTVEWYREQGLLASANDSDGHHPSHARQKYEAIMTNGQFNDLPELTSADLSAKMEQFDSFWEGPENIEKGYKSFGHFYRANYMPYVPKDRDVKILAISCGPGYFVNVLKEDGYTDLLGIDSVAEKVEHAQKRHLNCITAEAVDFLCDTTDQYDVIMCEQELNHLTKDEMIYFLRLCESKMTPGGTLLVHGLNGANPLTGPDASSQNWDHFNTFTEYSLQQVLEYTGFEQAKAIPLKLYVFYSNPLNYVGMAIMWTLETIFRIGFKLYGKNNKIFTKKVGGVAKKSKAEKKQINTFKNS